MVRQYSYKFFIGEIIVAKHRKCSEWQLLVNKFLQNKDTMYNYCVQNGINVRTFKNWHYKLKPAAQRHLKPN